MCLEVAQHCSTSSTPNESEVSSSPQVSLTLHQRLSMVKHLRRLLYFPVLRNLRERRHDHRVLLGVLPYPPTINDCNHLISNDINRGAVTTCITPHWRRRRLCGDSRTHPTLHNRGAVADSAIFARKYRKITWRGWCQAYCHTPLRASMQEINRPYRKKASHATNGMRCFCVASPGLSDLSDQSDLSWEIDYFTITFLPLTIYIPADRDCRSSCIFTPSIL